MEIFSVHGVIRLDDKDFSRGIDAADEKGRGFAAGFAKVGKAVAAGAAAAAAAIAGIGVASIRAGVDYDGAMRAIQAQTGMAGDDIAKLSGHFRNAALEGNFTAQELASAFADVAVAGQDAETGIALMDNAMLLAGATGNDLGQAAYFLGNYLLKVGKDATEADKYVDLFTHGIRNTGISLANMQNYMFRMTPAFQQFGADSETNIAIMTRLYQAGIRGANLYSGMGTILMESATGVGNFADMLANANYRTNVFNDLSFEFYEGMALNEEQLFEVSKAMAEYHDQTAIAAEVSGALTQTQQAAWFEFMNLSEEIRNEVIPGFHDLAGATYAFDKRMGGLGTEFGRTRAGLNDMKLSLFELIETPAAEFLGRFNDRLLDIAKRVRPGGDLHGPLQNVAAAFARLAETALGLAERALPVVIGVLGGAANALVAALDVVNRFLPAIAGLTAAFVAYKKAVAIQAVIQGLIGGLKAKTGVVKGATIAQKAWNLAMKLNPIGAVTAAVAGLAVGIGILAARMNEVSAEGRTLADAARDITNAIYDNHVAHTERAAAMEDEAATIQELISRISELNGKEEKTLEQRQRMGHYVRRLADAMPELALAYDAETDALNKSIDAIERQADARAAQQRYADARKYQLQVIHEEARAEEALAAIREQLSEVTESYGELSGHQFIKRMQHRNEIELLTRREAELANNLGYASGAVERMRVEVWEASEAYREASRAVDEYNQSLEEFGRGVTGVSGSAVAALRGMAERSHEMARTVEEAMQAWADATEAAFEAQEAKLSAIGSEYQRVAGIATNAFSRMSGEVSASLEQMRDNLLANAEKTREWGDNISTIMQAAMERGVDKGVLKQLEAMANRGSGYAAMMVNDLEFTFGELAPAMGEASQAAVDKVAQVWELDTSLVESARSAGYNVARGFQEYINEYEAAKIAAAYAQSFAEQAQADFKVLRSQFYAGAQGLPEGVAEGIDFAMPSAVNATSKLGGAMIESFKYVLDVKSPSGVFEEFGVNIAQGVALGINSAMEFARTAARSLANKIISETQSALGISSPSRRFAREVGAPIPEGMAMGIAGNAGKPVKALEELNRQLLDSTRQYLSDRRIMFQVSAYEEAGIWRDVLQDMTEGTREHSKAVNSYNLLIVN